MIGELRVSGLGTITWKLYDGIELLVVRTRPIGSEVLV